MSNLRVFGKSVDPAKYRRGFGVLGFLVFLLNLPRLWLERLIIEGILVIEVRKEEHLAPPALFVQQERVLASHTRVLDRDPPKTTHETRLERAAARYSAMRPNSDDADVRPVPVPEGLVRYLMEATGERGARYARKAYVSVDDQVFTPTGEQT